MLKLIVVVGLVLVGLAAPVAAQTSVLTLQWTQPLAGAQTLADAQAFTYALKINTAAPTLVTPTCVVGTPAPICTSAPIPGLKSGDVLVLTASNGIGSASSDPLTIGAGAGKPINVTVIVKVTVP